jgi:hypothetical protein
MRSATAANSPAGGRDLDPARTALEQPDTELRLEPLKHAGKRRLGNPESRGSGNEAAVLGQRQHRLQLTRPDIRKCGAHHQAASMPGKSIVMALRLARRRSDRQTIMEITEER